MLRKPTAKIGGPFETAKRNLLKSVKGFEKVRASAFSPKCTCYFKYSIRD